MCIFSSDFLSDAEFREEFDSEEMAQEFYKGLTYFESDRIEVDSPFEENGLFVVTFRRIHD